MTMKINEGTGPFVCELFPWPKVSYPQRRCSPLLETQGFVMQHEAVNSSPLSPTYLYIYIYVCVCIEMHQYIYIFIYVCADVHVQAYGSTPPKMWARMILTFIPPFAWQSEIIFSSSARTYAFRSSEMIPARRKTLEGAAFSASLPLPTKLSHHPDHYIAPNVTYPCYIGNI